MGCYTYMHILLIFKIRLKKWGGLAKGGQVITISIHLYRVHDYTTYSKNIIIPFSPPFPPPHLLLSAPCFETEMRS